jgi:hypothetical protein
MLDALAHGASNLVVGPIRGTGLGIWRQVRSHQVSRETGQWKKLAR